MAIKKRRKAFKTELDSVFVLKVVLLMLLGSFWFRLQHRTGLVGLPMPVGFLLGLLLVQHEHFQIDRKFEYAILVVAMFVSYWLPIGVVLSL